MLKKPIISTTLGFSLAALFLNSTVFAGDIEWSGLYRIEGYQLHNSELRGSGYDSTNPRSGKKQLAYGLSHLVLRPKITAGDGLTIYGQFDIFNSPTEANSQMGQLWGSGVRSEATTPTSQDNSNTLSHTQNAETIQVSQLYLTYNHEFGQLIAGRAPVHFGLGITHNAGRGLFDHYYDTRDMVGYKVIMGNLYVLPMLGKPSAGNINRSNNLDDYMIQVQYESPETDLEMGLFYQWRKGGDQAADAPIGVGTDQALGGPGASNAPGCAANANESCSAPVDTKTVNIYVARDSERIRLAMEGSFVSGSSGVVTSSHDKVTWSGFGLAGELEYRPEASRWKWGLKAGYSSGDDPATVAKYEGFSFNRNYDVAMLMFNHPLGQADFLRTGAVIGKVYDGTTNNINRPDVEAISNAIYVAPIAKYAFNDHWSLDNSIITGWLSTNPMLGQKAKALGYEWDLHLNYSPRKGVAWINEMGFLFPGSAWKGDGTYESSMAYGFGTKAAISF